MKISLSCMAAILLAGISVATQEPDTVRVAAVQCPSRMGKTSENLANIATLVRKAASQGAKIVVLPECSVQGYMDPTTWTAWSKASEDTMSVRSVAEAIPGPSTRFLGQLARDCGIYLCAGLIEAGTNAFFNAQILLSPQGAIVAHHRKKSLWTPGDSTWCTAGKRPAQVVQTEYGRLGLMICYDYNSMPKRLAREMADIVLYSVGWYGPNARHWFSRIFPRKHTVPHGFDLVAANWSSQTKDEAWPGCGHSCIITREGRVLGMSDSMAGNDIVMADLAIRPDRRQEAGETASGE